MGLIVIIGFLYAAYILYVIISSMMMISMKIWKSEESPFRLLVSDIIHTVIAPIIGFLRYDEYGSDIPFAQEHVLTVIILVFFSSVSFWLSRFTRTINTPIQNTLLSIGILQGMILCLIMTIHFLDFIPNGLALPMFGFELLSPLIAFFLLLKEFYFVNRSIKKIPETGLIYLKIGSMKISYEIINKLLYYRIFLYPILLVTLILFEIGIACLLGQDFDAIMKAFTESKGFIFSNDHFYKSLRQ